MPRYDYQCSACGHRFELRQGFDSDPVADCPACGRESSRRFHSVPVVFKGSGWYVNDHGRQNNATSSLPKEPSEDKPADRSDAKADAKANAKPKDPVPTSSTQD